MEGGGAKAPTITPGLSRFFMMFMVLLTLFVLFDARLRTEFGNATGFLLFPLIGFDGHYPLLTILLAGLVTTLISVILRHYFTDWTQMAKNQKIMSAFSKERREAMMRRDMSKLKKLTEAQQALMKDTMKTSWSQMKPMAFTMLLFIVIFAWLSNFVYVDISNTTFAAPWSFDAKLTDLNVMPNWILVYMLLGIPFGQILQRFLKYLSFRKKLNLLPRQ